MVINQVSEIPTMGNKCHEYCKKWQGGGKANDRMDDKERL